MENETLASSRSARLRRFAPKVLACFLLMCLVSVVFAPPAHASWIEDALGAVGGWLSDAVADLLRPAVEACLNLYRDTMKVIGTENFLTQGFKSIFGDGEGTDAVWQTINAVHKTLVVPLGGSILALVMLVQVVKISQRIDSTATFPAVKEIVFLAVLFVILRWLILNSVDLCAAMYDEFNKITLAIFDSPNTGIEKITIPDSIDGGNMILLLLISLLLVIAGLVAAVIAWVMTMARGIQLYILATFSPIPISLLGFEQTRSMGVSFFKNFAAVCLAGAIMAFVVTIFPTLCANYMGTGALFTFTENGAPVLNPVPLIAWFGLPVLLIIGIVKSGAWARDLLGG